VRAPGREWGVLPPAVVAVGALAFAAAAVFWWARGVWPEVMVSGIGMLVCVACARPAPPPPPPYDDGDYP